MKPSELISRIENGLPAAVAADFRNADEAKKRLTDLLDAFARHFGDTDGVELFSVGGRTEISGNHTDHNGGLVLAGAIDRNILVAARKNDDGVIRLLSAGYPENTVTVSEVTDLEKYKKVNSSALIAGVAAGIIRKGYAVGGFDAVTVSDVPKGSGLSSSAAFEVAVGTVLNHLYCDAKLTDPEIAAIGQYAENVYFGKPCGLLDQTACAVGGLVSLDFADPKAPVIRQIEWPFVKEDLLIAIVNVGSSHADLGEDYAAVPAEMKAVAAMFGKPVLRGVTEKELLCSVSYIRRSLGDRAFLRALHFIRENKRVESILQALEKKDPRRFLRLIEESGRSSYEYLQNIYSPKNPKEQSVALALALADGYMKGKPGAYRVHGGGFAGTIQVFLRSCDYPGLRDLMDGVFGKGATMPISIRKDGAKKIEL